MRCPYCKKELPCSICGRPFIKGIPHINCGDTVKSPGRYYPIIYRLPEGEYKGECLTEKVCREDRKRGGAGVALVSCPCPKCRPRL